MFSDRVRVCVCGGGGGVVRVIVREFNMDLHLYIISNIRA